MKETKTVVTFCDQFDVCFQVFNDLCKVFLDLNVCERATEKNLLFPQTCIDEPFKKARILLTFVSKGLHLQKTVLRKVQCGGKLVASFCSYFISKICVTKKEPFFMS